MSKKIMTLFFLVLNLACYSQTNIDSILCGQKVFTKSELLQNGYRTVHLGKEEMPDWYIKLVGDTSINFLFNDDTLERIMFHYDLRKVDSTNLMASLARKGFVLDQPDQDQWQWLILSSNKKIRYRFYCSKNHLQLLRFLYISKYPKPQIPMEKVGSPIIL